jgi:hypothetical protein
MKATEQTGILDAPRRNEDARVSRMTEKAPPLNPPAKRRETGAETPLDPPVNGGKKKRPALSTARRKDDETLRRVVGEVLLRNTVEAEAILRTFNECKGQLAKHQHGQQIERVEEYFKQQTGHEPWPERIPDGMLMHFRGKIGMVLNRVKLARLLEDIKAAKEVKNLIYFLSTDSGKKASRWEMLMVEAREEELVRNKALERAEMQVAWERIFGGKDEGGRMKDETKKVEPTWVIRQKAERDNLIYLNKAGASTTNYHENKQRISDINRRLQHWDKTGK